MVLILSIVVRTEESEWLPILYAAGVFDHTLPHSAALLTAMEPRSGGRAAVTQRRPVVTKVTGDSWVHTSGGPGDCTLPPAHSLTKLFQRRRNEVSLATRAGKVKRVSLVMLRRKSAKQRRRFGRLKPVWRLFGHKEAASDTYRVSTESINSADESSVVLTLYLFLLIKVTTPLHHLETFHCVKLENKVAIKVREDWWNHRQWGHLKITPNPEINVQKQLLKHTKCPLTPKALSRSKPSIQNQYSWSEKSDSRCVSLA